MDEAFLKGLELPEEVIPKILAAHSKELGEKTTQLSAEAEKLKTANQTIQGLQEAAKAFDGVDVGKLKEEMASLQTKYDQDLAAVKLDHALELALVSNQARNTKAVKALLDPSKIKMDGDTLTGLEEQLKTLRESEDSKFLFAEKETVQFSGMKPAEGSGGIPNPKAIGWETRLNEAKKAGDNLAVIQIKREAYADGVVLP